LSGWVACLDADVLISMPDCDLLLEIARTGLYTVRWSPTILDEVRRNLPKANTNITPALAEKRIATMRAAFPEAEVSEDGGRVFTVHERVHPKDRHVVATALVGQANVIVTRNRSDFAVDDLEAVGLLVQGPDEFLLHQVTQNPVAVCNAVGAIIGRLVNSKPTVEEYLGLMETRFPVFAAALRPHAGSIPRPAWERPGPAAS
jgi:predicted nucleic acid-binding protein